MQDRDALEGADASKAWEYSCCVNIEEEEEGGACGALVVYLDKESIDLLARAPDREELERMFTDDRAGIA